MVSLCSPGCGLESMFLLSARITVAQTTFKFTSFTQALPEPLDSYIELISFLPAVYCVHRVSGSRVQTDRSRNGLYNVWGPSQED
jgi:hypothetical protein